MKTARAQEANVGIRNKFAKKLVQFSNQFRSMVLNDILLHLASEGALAEDESFFSEKSDQKRKLLQSLRNKVLSAWKTNPEAFKDDIEGYVESRLADWTLEANKQARLIALWLARSVAADVSASQRQAYTAAGMPPDYIKLKFVIPVMRSRMSQRAAEVFPFLVESSTELITKMSVRDVQKLQNLLIKSFAEGHDVSKVKSLLLTMDGFNVDRAKNVALDQTNKITTGIQIANDEDLGITEGVWVHVPGQYSSRHTHVAMNGKKFNLREGLFDSDVKRNVQPSELPYCFPGESELNYSPPIMKLYRRRYSGEFAEIVTDDGASFLVTPNHPILTPRGMVRAGALNVGDYLFNVSGEDFDTFKSEKDKKPTSIAEVFDSFLLATGGALVLDGSNGQFHGDGSNGKVDVIDVCGFLADGFKPGAAEGFIKDVFARTKKAGEGFLRNGLFNEDFLRFFDSRSGGMSLGNDRLSFISRHFSHADVARLGTIAALNAVGVKEPCDYASGNAESICNRELRLACNVIIQTLNGYFSQSGVGVMKSVSLDPSFEGSQINSIFGKCFVNRTSRLDTLKRVQEIRFINRTCHVYNLETWSGWYICNYTAVGNCRCTYRAVMPF